MGASIIEHFAMLDDPRLERGKAHQLLDIVVLAICAVWGGGAESWEAIEAFGHTKLDWVRRKPVGHGFLVHDTLARVSARGFERCFASWVRACAEVSEGEVVALTARPRAVPMTGARARMPCTW